MKRFTRHFIEQKDVDSLKYDKVDEKPTPLLQGEDWKNISVPGLSYPVKLIGQVDRIDKLDGVTRIIDYKTGKILPSNLKLSKIENLFSGTQFASSFQLLSYFYLYSSYLENNDAVQAGIISFKNMNHGLMSLKKSNAAYCDRNELNEFKKILDNLIEEIFNPEVTAIKENKNNKIIPRSHG